MDRREIQYAVGWAVAIMLVTCVPYLIAWWFLPHGAYYPWVLFNSDDHAVYFAWMRQAEEGRVLFRNLFTTDPQRGIYLHVYFLALGGLSRLTGLDVPVVYHLGRVLFGAAVLVLVYRLGAFFTSDLLARRCIFWTTAVGAGLGWLFWRDHVVHSLPVDVWQPEALTFSSLYTNGLFNVSLALMLGIVVCLLLAFEQPGRAGWRWAAAAGVCGLLLGNIHSYDVIHLSAVWVAFLAVRGVASRRFPLRELGLSLAAAAIAAPSVAHMAWFYATEPIFRARADTATLTPPIRLYVLGYGLLLPLALAGGVNLWRNAAGVREAVSPDPLRRFLPLVWAVAGIAVAYLPFAFQRKLIMGYHLPLGLLAGLGAAALARAAAKRVPVPRGAAAAAAVLIALTLPSSVLYMWRDVKVALTENVTSTGEHPVYWPGSDIRAMEWLGRHAPPDAVLLAYPVNGNLAPGISARAVYAGHWGETPRYVDRRREIAAFLGGTWSSDERRRFLRENGIEYVLYGPREQAVRQVFESRGLVESPPLPREPFLEPVFSEGETTLFRVR